MMYFLGWQMSKCKDESRRDLQHKVAEALFDAKLWLLIAELLIADTFGR